MIVLIAPARNPFFAEFIGRFQNYAETQDALLLYVEKPRLEELETVSIGCTNGGCAMRSSGWRTFRWMWRS